MEDDDEKEKRDGSNEINFVLAIIEQPY